MTQEIIDNSCWLLLEARAYPAEGKGYDYQQNCYTTDLL